MRGSFTVKINNYAKKEDYVFDLIQKIGSLPEKDQEKYRTSCRVMVYDYNDMLMFNGFSGEFACFLVSGLVASRYYNFESNKDQYMTFYKQQELFYPSHEVFDEDHTEEELVVFSDKAIIVVIPEDIMHEYQDKSPFFNEMLREQMAYQLQKERLYNIYCNLSSTRERIKNTLFYLAVLYGDVTDEKWVRLPRRIDQNVLASYTRASTSLVNMIVKEYCSQGLAKRGRRKLLLDRKLVMDYVAKTGFNKFLVAVE